MKIGGLQNLTLLDYPDKTACIVFTNGCNLRCPYCHNASLVTRTDEYPLAEEAQVFSLLKKRKGILDGVVITGGEPLLQQGIEEFIDKIKDMGYCVKLDTNGTFPDRLEALIRQKKSGLRRHGHKKLSAALCFDHGGKKSRRKSGGKKRGCSNERRSALRIPHHRSKTLFRQVLLYGNRRLA